MKTLKENIKETGATLVEFAIVLPVLMLFVAGVFDFGRYIFAYAQTSNALRTALREAPVIGYEGESPGYLNCRDMLDIAEDVFFVDVNVTIEYHDGEDGSLIPGGGNCTTNGALDDDAVENGDYIVMTSTGELQPIFAGWINSITLNFVGQRTILKTIQLGGGSNDYDYDGIDDDWEESCYGTTSYSATDDSYNNAAGSAVPPAEPDGINNGEAEANGHC